MTLLLTFSLLWFLLSLVLVWPWQWQPQICCIWCVCPVVLIRPLLRGKRREIINFNLTNLSFGNAGLNLLKFNIDTPGSPGLFNDLKLQPDSKTSNNILFLSTSLIPKNINAYMELTYFHHSHSNTLFEEQATR